MGLPFEELVAHALQLSREERARLAHRLIVSLEARTGDAIEVERAWATEIRRRLDEVDAGTAELIPAEQVFAELRARASAASRGHTEST